MATQSETTSINLQHRVTINGKSYGPGTGITVPRNQADDLLRMDYEHQQYRNNLQTKQTYEVNAGSIAVGGGAE
jgi:hypothetical protein